MISTANLDVRICRVYIYIYINTIANLVPYTKRTGRNRYFTAADQSARYSTFFAGTE